MRRPATELRKLEDEERRRTRAHRKLVWERRFRAGLWIVGLALLLIAIALLSRLSGFSVG